MALPAPAEFPPEPTTGSSPSSSAPDTGASAPHSPASAPDIGAAPHTLAPAPDTGASSSSAPGWAAGPTDGGVPAAAVWALGQGSLADQEQWLIGVRDFVARLPVGTLTGPQADRLLGFAARVERLGAALKMLVAPTVDDTYVWRQEGHRSAASYLAERTGSTVGDAVGVLETARQLGELPATATCLRRGDFSAAQVREVAAAATVHRGAESELLDIAARGSLRSLRERCRQLKALASWETDEVGRYNAIRRSRFCRSYTDVAGALCLEARLTPDDGARLLAAVRAKAGVLADEARAAGAPPASAAAYQADGLVSLADDAMVGTGTGVGRPTVVLRVDAAALRRGETADDEVCEIPGVGPVPLATATRLLGDAYVKIVVRDGVDVTGVCHPGRTVPAHLDTALAERDRTCSVPRCDATERLETHHRLGVTAGGPSSLANLVRLCKWHHDMVTYDGYRLTGRPGDWQWHPPPPGGPGPRRQ